MTWHDPQNGRSVVASMPATVEVDAAKKGNTPRPSNSHNLTLRSSAGFFTKITSKLLAETAIAASETTVNQVKWADMCGPSWEQLGLAGKPQTSRPGVACSDVRAIGHRPARSATVLS